MYCHKCGSKILEGARFCPHCGESLSQIDSIPNDVSAVYPIQKQRTSTVNQKDVLAREIITNLKLGGLSLVIGVISIFVIREINNDNLSGLINTSNRDLVIKANQAEAVREDAPKVFFYSLIGLVVGRYIILGIGWADKRTKENENDIKNE